MKSKYTDEEIIKKYKNKKGEFVWGVETVIDSLTHNVEYKLNADRGVYTLTKWNCPEPTSEEIKEEYDRQEALANHLKHLKEKTLLGRLKKLFKTE
jgi:hypothetical protein